MKIEEFSFLHLPKLRAIACPDCNTPLDESFKITFIAMAGGKWEMIAECRKCHKNYTWAVKMTHAYGSGKNISFADLNQRMKDVK